VFCIIFIQPSDRNQRLSPVHKPLSCRRAADGRGLIGTDGLQGFEILPAELWSIMGNVVCEAVYSNLVNLKIGCGDPI